MSLSHFLNEHSKAQGDEITCPNSLGKLELVFECRVANFNPNPFFYSCIVVVNSLSLSFLHFGVEESEFNLVVLCLL